MLHLRHCARAALTAAAPLRQQARLAPVLHSAAWSRLSITRSHSLRLFSTAPPSTPSSSTPASSADSSQPPPRTTADETTDAEAGLNQSVKAGQQQAKQEKTKEELEREEDELEDAKAAKQQKEKHGPVSWSSVGFLILVGGAAVVYFRYQQDKAQNSVRIETVGTPMLGGSWSLVDDTGKRVTSEDFHGRYTLLYFGFTHCPDICPTELKKMEEALNLYEKMHPNHPITPIFISIDPKRDTPARLLTYKKDYDPRMLWLTGSDSDVSAVAKKFRVYYSAPDVDQDDDYLVDHSIFFYLMDREGQFMEFFGKSKSADEVAGRMAQLVAAENKK